MCAFYVYIYICTIFVFIYVYTDVYMAACRGFGFRFQRAAGCIQGPKDNVKDPNMVCSVNGIEYSTWQMVFKH